MTNLRGITRRQLVLSAGSGVLGVAVLGVVSACSSSSSSSAPTTPAGALRWERVNLSFVSAYLLLRGAEVAIVDLGTAGSQGAIEAGLRTAGVGWDAVRHIVLTHRHPDHVGGLAGVAPLTDATIYAGREDVAAITSPDPVRPLADGDEVFGLRMIATPGHTPGHVSVFDPVTGVLVAGDALRTTNGLAGSDPRYTADDAAAAASVRKLATLDVRVILPGHGEPLTAGAAEALRTLASRGASASP